MNRQDYISYKIKKLKEEHPSWKDSKVKAVAYEYEEKRKKDGGKYKEYQNGGINGNQLLYPTREEEFNATYRDTEVASNPMYLDEMSAIRGVGYQLRPRTEFMGDSAQDFQNYRDSRVSAPPVSSGYTHMDTRNDYPTTPPSVFDNNQYLGGRSTQRADNQPATFPYGLSGELQGYSPGVTPPQQTMNTNYRGGQGQPSTIQLTEEQVRNEGQTQRPPVRSVNELTTANRITPNLNQDLQQSAQQGMQGTAVQNTNTMGEQRPVQNQTFNPYAGIDIPSAAAYLGQSIENRNTLGTVASGAKLATGLARNVFGAMGAQRRENFINQEYDESQRDYLSGRNNATYVGEDGGTYKNLEIKPFDVYQNGGRKEERLPQEKVMTGEYMTGASESNRQVNQNAELEDNEYILSQDGTSIKVEGKTHEQGGEEVELKEGDMVISDNLKLTGKYSKQLRDEFDVKVKAKDTFASAVDKIYKKIGLQKLIDDEVKMTKRIKEEEENTEDATTKNLNLQFLYKEKKKLEEKKQELEPQRQQALQTVFNLQEESKPKEEVSEQTEMYQDGGRFQNWINNLRGFGYEGRYDSEIPIEDQVGDAQRWLVENRPEVVQSYFQEQPITSRGLTTIAENNPDVFTQTGIDRPENLADLSPEDRVTLQNAYRETLEDDEYNSFLLDQFQDNMFEYRAPLLSQQGQTQIPQQGGEVAAQEEQTDDRGYRMRTQEPEQRVQQNIPLFPDQSPVPPSSLQPSLRQTRRYDRLNPYEVSPEQVIQENERQAQAAYQSVQGLSDSQRAAAVAQINAGTQGANAQAISQAETQNVGIRNQVAGQNAQIQMREEDAAAQDALSYEQRTQTAQAITEEQRQQYMDFMRRLNSQRFNDVRRMNTVNQIFPNYNIDSLGNIDVQGTLTPEEQRQLMRQQIQSGAYNIAPAPRTNNQ